MEPFSGALAGIAKDAISRSFAERSSRRAEEQAAADRVEQALFQHLAMVSSWCSTVQIFGMPRPADIHDVTVPLFLDFPRRYRHESSPSTTIDEDEVLAASNSTLVLGDLGAGKTTCLKRLAFRILNGNELRDHESFPIVVVCRSETWSESSPLEVVLSRMLGLVVERLDGEKPEDYHARVLSQVVKFIDSSSAALLIDGIDEIPVANRDAAVGSAEAIAQRLVSARVIASARTGEVVRDLQGWNVLEMCPLTDSQVESITDMLLGERSEIFREACRSSPIADLLQRPLFVAHLCFIFERNGEIPEQPSSVYRQIVALSLRDWDHQRGVVRGTRYANFHPEDKIEFLASLAFHLMTKLEGSVAVHFSSVELQVAYSILAPRFGLPKHEASEVAREIASHTGIISEGPDGFSFTHLSLQEYLVAYALVKRPLLPATSHSLPEFGPYVAVAAALSSSPADWLGNAILNGYRRKGPPISDQFWRRILIEKTVLEESLPLGYALLTLLDAPVSPALKSILNQSEVRRSLSLAARPYWASAAEGSLEVSLVMQEDALAQHLGAPATATITADNMNLIDASIDGPSLSVGMNGVDYWHR